MGIRNLYSILLTHLTPFICIFYLFLNNGHAVFGDVNQKKLKSNHTYTIRDVRVNGNVLLDAEVIIDIAGFKKGEKIQLPTVIIQKAIHRLWQQQFISNVSIHASDIIDDTLVINIDITESARLSKWVFKGVKKSIVEKLEEHVTLSSGIVITESFLKETRANLKQYFLDKGFFNVTVYITRIPDKEKKGFEKLEIKINSGKKAFINEIIIEGNQSIDSQTLKQAIQGFNEKPRFTLFSDLFKKIVMLQPLRKNGILRRLPTFKEVVHYIKRHVILFASEFTEARYDMVKQDLLHYYQSKGFRDVKIIKARIDQPISGRLNLYFKIEEGKQYFIKSIKWIGNYIYNAEELNQVLDIYPKDVYDPIFLKKQLMCTASMEEKTVGNLYMHNGYMFFNVKPVEIGIDGNQVALEIRLQEGPKAVINKVLITGNTITHESVIRRELVTYPGDQLSFSKVVQSIQNLIMLNLFAIEKLQSPEAFLITPNPDNGTVDITFHVVEKINLSIQANSSFGGGKLNYGLFLGTNNFSINNFLKLKRPLGDAQQCNINIGKGINRGKTDPGSTYFSFEFLEPWLGGKVPNSFHVNLSHSFNKTSDLSLTPRHHLAALGIFPLCKFKKEAGSIQSTGGGISFGRKLYSFGKDWKYFLGMNFYYSKYKMVPLFPKREISNYDIFDLTFYFSLKHSNINHPLFPNHGWIFDISVTSTPPYSLFMQKHSKEKEKYRLKEYHKWMIDFGWFQNMIGDLVFHLGGNLGIVGGFSKKDNNPFCRFSLGGGKQPKSDKFFDSEHISLRGYPEDALTPKVDLIDGGSIYQKLVSELRYPIILSSLCSIYVLAFAEAAGNWFYYSDYNLLDMKKSVGFGIRASLPMFLGLLPDIALDWGYRLDDAKSINPKREKFEFHFAIGLGGR